VRRYRPFSAFAVLFSSLSLTPAALYAVGPDTQPAHEQPYKSEPGPLAVETVKYEWRDAKRDREVPVKIYFPKTGQRPFPVIIFSHGLGGSRDGYEYLGQHWAGHGYVCVHPQHKGSDTAILATGGKDRKQAMRRAAADPRNAIDRAKDVSFVIDELEKLNEKEGPLHGQLDLKRIGMAGHSFGANTTLAVIGEIFIGPREGEIELADPRVKAAVAMSSPVPGRPDRYDRAFGGIRTPCLHLTGTLDMSPVNDTTAAQRRIPFDHIHRAEQYLVIFKDADHMVFGGPQLRGDGDRGARAARVHDLIRMSTTAFWDAYLRENTKAKRWLAEGGFETVMGSDGTFAKKSPSTQAMERP